MAQGRLMSFDRKCLLYGADIGVKTTHLTAMATNLIVYNRLFFVKQVKKCVELNEGSNYCFTSCIFEDSGTSGMKLQVAFMQSVYRLMEKELM